MNKAEKYDSMVLNPMQDDLGIFMNYELNILSLQNDIRKYEPSVIYDLGCGTGNVTGHLSTDFQVIGIDRSEEMLEQAKIKFPSMQFINCDLNESTQCILPKAGDVLVLSYVLHSFKEKTEILEWLFNSVRRGAKVLLLDYMFQNIEHRQETLNYYLSIGRLDLVHLIESKHFIHIDLLEAHPLSNKNAKLNKVNLCKDIWKIELSSCATELDPKGAKK